MKKQFNVYGSAKEMYEEMADIIGKENINAKTTLSELYEILKDDSGYNYEYSVYTSELIQVLADDLAMLGYCEDVENELGTSLIKNPLYINYAIQNYALDKYGDNDADYFNSENWTDIKKESDDDQGK